MGFARDKAQQVATAPASLNIYAAIQRNRRKTLLLIVAFILMIAAVVLLFGVAIGLPMGAAMGVAGISVLVSALASYWAYRSGDSVVLSISGARPADPQRDRALYRTVENLCIGAGTPMPKVYVIEDGAMNAFATGRDPEHASVAITRGLLEKLEPLELEGVLAHELSHIRNLDIRLMMVTAVLVGIVAIMADLALRLTWYGAGSRRRYKGKGEGAGGAILLIAAIVAMIIAPLAARIIQMVVSREREYLADASGALLTRYPAGLASALQKIAGDKDPLDSVTKGTAHLFFSDPLKAHGSKMNSLFSTHPPIEQRVARLRAMGS